VNKDDAGATTGRPGSPRDDSQFVEQPGRREHLTGTTPPTAPKKR